MANEVRVLITADDRATPTIKSIAGGIIAADAAMKAFNTTVGGLKSVVSVAADFEHAISSVGAVSGATKDQLKQLSDTALRIGKDTQFGAREAAGAMEILAANGISVADIMGGAADAAATLAAAGGTNLAQAADTVSTAMAVWGASTEDLTDYVNRLAGAANVSRFGVEDMSQAIAQGGGVAASVGVDFKDFSASIAATATSFSSGSDAGTSFKTFLQRLAAPTDEAARLMAELGINAFDANNKMRPMGEIVQQLHDSLGSMSEAQRAQAASMIFGSDAMRTAMGLAGLTREEFEKLSDTMGDTSALDVAKERTDNLAGAWEQFKGAIETLQIEIGQKLLPVLTELVTWGSEKLPLAFAWIEQHWGPAFAEAASAAGFLRDQLGGLSGFLAENEGLATALADGIAIATAGMVAFAVASAAAALVNPFTATILAIEALTVALVYLVQNWDDVEAAANEAADGVTDTWEGVADWFGGLPDMIGDAVGDLGSTLYDAGGDLISGLYEGALEAAEGYWKDFLWGLPAKSVDWIKDAADGHSPWGITEPLGQDLVAGIQVGAEGAMPALSAAIQSGISSVVSEATQVLQSHLSNMINGVQYVLGGYSVGDMNSAENYANSIGLVLGEDGQYSPDPNQQGPFLGMSPKDIAMANQKAREAIAAMNQRAFNLGGGGSSGGSSGTKKTAAEALAESLAEATRNASLALAFGDLGAKAMESFLDAFTNPSAANSLPAAVEKIVAQARDAGVPEAELLGSGLLQAMLDAFSGAGSIEDVQSRLNDITLATTNGIKNLVSKASAAFGDAALTDSGKKAAEKTLKGFQDALANGEPISAAKLQDFIDKLVDDSNEGWDTLREKTSEKLDDWLRTVTGKLSDAKPETADQLEAMIDGLESILDSAPLPDSMRAFADSAIDQFIQGIQDGKGIAIADLEAFIKEMVAKALAGAQEIKDAASGSGDASVGSVRVNAPKPSSTAGIGPNGTVWDEAAGAYVYPWEVGSNLPGRIIDWRDSPGFGFTGGGNQPIHITLNVDGRVLAEVVAAEMARAM